MLLGKRNSVVVEREGFNELYIFRPGSTHKWYGKYAYICIGLSALLEPITLAPKSEWRAAHHLHNPNNDVFSLADMGGTSLNRIKRFTYMFVTKQNLCECRIFTAHVSYLETKYIEYKFCKLVSKNYMIQLAENDQDDKRKALLEVIKETVLSHLTKKCPSHVQVIGLLCRTPQKESRHELLRRVAAGGGAFKSDNGTNVHLPGANLNDIANQADDLLETMETRPVVPDRKLLARLVLIREEARNMMGGGILDERNDRGFNTLPESEVNFLTKLVALKPGKTVREMIKNVMQGKDEGADDSNTDETSTNGGRVSSGIAGRGSVTGIKPLPVRPGMFLETVSKVLGGIYAGNVPGITAQHLEWVHQNTLEVLQEIAF